MIDDEESYLFFSCNYLTSSHLSFLSLHLNLYKSQQHRFLGYDKKKPNQHDDRCQFGLLANLFALSAQALAGRYISGKIFKVPTFSNRPFLFSLCNKAFLPLGLLLLRGTFLLGLRCIFPYNAYYC
jgi:hypothetical protein